MAPYGMDEPAREVPKRHTPWFTKLLFAFALLAVVLIIYGFVRAKPAAEPGERIGASQQAPHIVAERDTRREQRSAGWWSAAGN